MELAHVRPEGMEELLLFYGRVAEETKDADRYCRWKKGIYPSRNGLEEYARGGALYCCDENGRLAGAFALTAGQGEEYRRIPWQTKAEDVRIAVLHVLAVEPALQGRGFGGRLLREAEKLAREQGARVLRLDALEGNLPAIRLYTSFGFEQRGRLRLYAENTGHADFLFFEKELTPSGKEERDPFFQQRFGGLDRGLERMNGEERERLFADCARECAASAVGELYRGLFDRCGGDPDLLFSRLREREGLDGAVTEPGRVYELIFRECGCDLHTRAGMNSPGLCECSRLSVLRVMKTLMPDREFLVEKLETVLNGDARCRFRITVCGE